MAKRFTTFYTIIEDDGFYYPMYKHGEHDYWRSFTRQGTAVKRRTWNDAFKYLQFGKSKKALFVG